jgi:hypothetical protein
MVLLITLLVLAAMALASVGMMRSVDTSVTAVGNLGFRRAADAAINQAVENVVQNMQADGWLYAGALDDNFGYYYATIQPGANAQGIPAALLQHPTPSGVNRAGPDGAGNTTLTVVERMCNATGPANPANCGIAAWGEGSGVKDDPNKANEFPLPDLGGESSSATGSGAPFYRVSVRVDGPKNTVSFAQAIIYF